jgi:catechol 2,3-dioxygenase-like lactoylglutathione lyase family enzyme
MLHHVSFGVSNLERSAAFYDAALAVLGYVRVWTDSSAVGYGVATGQDLFAVKLRAGDATAPGAGFHLAFAAPSREAVARFHAEALAHGGLDNGVPGLRPAYGPNYFAAFVIDPDGYRIEAVTTLPI